MRFVRGSREDVDLCLFSKFERLYLVVLLLLLLQVTYVRIVRGRMYLCIFLLINASLKHPVDDGLKSIIMYKHGLIIILP